MELPSAGEAEAVGMDGRPTLPLPSVWPAAPKPNKGALQSTEKYHHWKRATDTSCSRIRKKRPHLLK